MTGRMTDLVRGAIRQRLNHGLRGTRRAVRHARPRSPGRQLPTASTSHVVLFVFGYPAGRLQASGKSVRCYYVRDYSTQFEPMKHLYIVNGEASPIDAVAGLTNASDTRCR